MITIPREKFAEIYHSKTKALAVLEWLWVQADKDGSIYTSTRSLSDMLGIGHRQVRSALDLLIDMHLIGQELRDTRETRFYICKSDTYSDSRHKRDTSVTNDRHKSDTNMRSVSTSYEDKRHKSDTRATQVVIDDDIKRHKSDTNTACKSDTYSDSRHKRDTSDSEVSTIYNISIDNNIDNNNIQDRGPGEDVDVCQKVLDMYHEICVSLPKVIKLTQKRKSSVLQRMKEIKSFDTLKQLLEATENSDFLSGRKTDWKASFDWLFCYKGNWIKVIEGNYKNISNYGTGNTKSNSSSYEERMQGAARVIASITEEEFTDNF